MEVFFCELLHEAYRFLFHRVNALKCCSLSLENRLIYVVPGQMNEEAYLILLNLVGDFFVERVRCHDEELLKFFFSRIEC